MEVLASKKISIEFLKYAINFAVTMNMLCIASLFHCIIKCHHAWLPVHTEDYIIAHLRLQKMFPDDIMFETFLSSADIAAIRQSWGLAKDAAPFEVHGPAFYHL